MRRFFLALRVRVQDVAGPFPDVVQAVQGAAEGILRHPAARAAFQGVLEQGHGPTAVRVAQALGRAGQQGCQQVLLVLVQQRWPTPARLFFQGRGVQGLAVGVDPVVDALPRHPEHAGDVRGGAAVVELQYGEGAPVKGHVTGLLQLPPQTPALPGCQVELAHRLLHQAQLDTEQMPCQTSAMSK
jgi:hypothetical protein